MKLELSSRKCSLIAVVISCLPMSSCVTQGTGNLVKHGHMTSDLEKKVLMETGVSGAAGGAIVGAGIGAFAGVAAEVIDSVIGRRNFDRENAKGNATVGAVAGGVTGGVIGYQQGRKQGEQLVSAAMSRDNVNNLLKGARAYNNGLKSYNSELRTRIATAKKDPDVAKRMATYVSLEREAKSQLNNANDRIAERSKAAGNVIWDGGQRREYKSTIEPLTAQRDSLKKQVDMLARLRTEGVY